MNGRVSQSSRRVESSRRRRRRLDAANDFAFENDAEVALAEHLEQSEILRIQFPLVRRFGQVDARREMRRTIRRQFELMNSSAIALLLPSHARDGDDDDDGGDDDQAAKDGKNDVKNGRLRFIRRS